MYTGKSNIEHAGLVITVSMTPSAWHTAHLHAGTMLGISIDAASIRPLDLAMSSVQEGVMSASKRIAVAAASSCSRTESPAQARAGHSQAETLPVSQRVVDPYEQRLETRALAAVGVE